METIQGPNPGPARQVWNFARHFLEMCIAMCIGGSLLMAAVFGVATQLGQPALREVAPGLSVLATAVIYTLPMAAWMLIRGMDARATAEMAVATLGVGVVLVGLAALGTMSTDDLSAWASAANPTRTTPTPSVATAISAVARASMPRINIHAAMGRV